MSLNTVLKTMRINIPISAKLIEINSILAYQSSNLTTCLWAKASFLANIWTI